LSKVKNTDGAIDDLGVLITAAIGLDRSWMERGTCYGWGSQRPGQPTPWQVSPSQKANGISGYELVKYAAMICFACPAQYDCLEFAVKGKINAGTWAVRLKTLEWLQGEEDALDLIAIARSERIPVQTIAAELMADRTIDA
jgi:hypothetical protein